MEGPALIQAVRAGQFDAIVSEVELERIDVGPGYARQRWHPDLVAAVLERYQMQTRSGSRALCRQRLRLVPAAVTSTPVASPRME